MYKIVAVDFDGTITEEGPWLGQGEFYPIRPGVIEQLTALQAKGWRVVIWTTRGDDIGLVKAYLDREGIPYDYINENPPDVPVNLSEKKIIADVYIDDRNFNWTGDWKGVADAVIFQAESTHNRKYRTQPQDPEPTDIRAYSQVASVLKYRYEKRGYGHIEAMKKTSEVLAQTLQYEDFFDDFTAFLRSEFITPTMANTMKRWAEKIASYIRPTDRIAAGEIFKEKNTARGGQWRQVGAKGALIEIHGKLTRLSNPKYIPKAATGYATEDEWTDACRDLFNYLVIFILCLNEKIIHAPAKHKQPVIITGTHQGGLGAMLSAMFRLNGYRVYGLNAKLQQFKTHNNTRMLDAAAAKMAKIREVVDQDYAIDYPEDNIEDLPAPWVINNWGINRLNWIEDTGTEQLSIIDVNLKWPMLVVKAYLREFGKHPGARILNISSQTYRVAQRTTSAYCASKAGLSHLTKVMNRELAPYKIIVNALAPGMIVDTIMSQKTNQQVADIRGWEDSSADEYAKSLIPLNRYTDREEVALAALKIMNLPDYICGTTIDMTGGQ